MKIRTLKRRIVKPEDRKNAAYSCDRCKLKKVACKRQPSDSENQPCMRCVDAGTDCKTTIKRKRNLRRPSENIGLHYKCLHSLVKGLYPDSDVNSIDSLIKLGESLGISMPSRLGVSAEEREELLEITYKLTSTHPSSENISEELPTNSPPLECEISNTGTMVLTPHFTQPDSIIVDLAGTFHFVGPFGAAGFLDSCVNIMVKQTMINSDLWQNYQKLFQSEIIISSHIEPLTSSKLERLSLANFPFLNFLNRKELDYYFETFIQFVHPRYFCFNETQARSKYETFWLLLLLDISNETMLSNPQICIIYMMLVLGWLYKPYNQTEESNGVMELNQQMVNKIVDIVRICLSDMLLSPTLDGIRCMILLSLYMDNSKKRDSGYCLLELASRQAVSIGLNRQSVYACIDDAILKEEMQCTWWTLFKLELTFSNQMGRSSCLLVEEIDVPFPSFANMKCPFKYFFNSINELNLLLYELLKFRSSVSGDCLKPGALVEAASLLKKFKDWYHNLRPDVKTCLHRYTEKDVVQDMLCRYHYYIISLCLPFLLHAANGDAFPTMEIQEFAVECCESSIKMAEISTFSDENGLFNGTVFQDLFFLYHASMSLVTGYILITKFQISWDTINKTEIIRGMNLISKITSKNFNKLKGSNKKIGKFISILFNGLNILEFLGSDAILFSGVTNLTGTTATPKLNSTQDTERRSNKFPIIHIAKLPKIILSKKLLEMSSISNPPLTQFQSENGYDEAVKDYWKSDWGNNLNNSREEVYNSIKGVDDV